MNEYIAFAATLIFNSLPLSFRLRQQHQKLILQLEQRQQQEMYEHRKALEREFESQMHTFDKEMERLKSKHRMGLESKVCLTVFVRVSLFIIAAVNQRAIWSGIQTFNDTLISFSF